MKKVTGKISDCLIRVYYTEGSHMSMWNYSVDSIAQCIHETIEDIIDDSFGKNHEIAFFEINASLI